MTFGTIGHGDFLWYLSEENHIFKLKSRNESSLAPPQFSLQLEYYNEIKRPQPVYLNNLHTMPVLRHEIEGCPRNQKKT